MLKSFFLFVSLLFTALLSAQQNNYPVIVPTPMTK